jgi:hypothetical protein
MSQITQERLISPSPEPANHVSGEDLKRLMHPKSPALNNPLGLWKLPSERLKVALEKLRKRGGSRE